MNSLQGRNLLGISAIAAMLTFAAIAYAAPGDNPSSPYKPAETLNPSCDPGDTDCTVEIVSKFLNGIDPDDAVYNEGNVGIGTNNPVHLLHLQSNANAYQTVETTSTGGWAGTYFKNSTGGTLWTGIGANGSSRPNQGLIQLNGLADSLRIESGVGDISFGASANTANDLFIGQSGNVGVGLNNPAYKFDVNGVINSTGGIRVGDQLITNFLGTGLVNTAGVLGVDPNSLSQWTKHPTTDELYYNDANVGIGISDPAYKLHVAGNTYAYVNLFAPSTATTAYGTGYSSQSYNFPGQGGTYKALHYGMSVLPAPGAAETVLSGYSGVTLATNGVPRLSVGRFGPTTIPQTTDLSLSSTTHPFMIGSQTGANISIDDNEIMARNNGAAAALYLQAEGGNLYVGANANKLSVTDAGVGAGTTTPSYPLHVTGPGNALNTAGTAPRNITSYLSENYSSDQTNYLKYNIGTFTSPVLTGNRYSYGNYNLIYNNKTENFTVGNLRHSYGYGVHGRTVTNGTNTYAANYGGTFYADNESSAASGLGTLYGVVGEGRNLSLTGNIYSVLGGSFTARGPSSGGGAAGQASSQITAATGVIGVARPYRGTIITAVGVDGEVETNTAYAGDITNAYGVRGRVESNSTNGGTIGNAYGGYFYTYKPTAVTTLTNNATGVYGRARDGVTNYAGQFLADDTEATTNYGLHVNASNASGNNYGIYGAAGNWVLPGGNLAVGSATVSPGLAVDITGKVGADEYCAADGTGCVLAGSIGADNLGNHIATTNITLPGYSVYFNPPGTTGGWARGNWWRAPGANTTEYGVGVFGSGANSSYVFMGAGANPYSTYALKVNKNTRNTDFGGNITLAGNSISGVSGLQFNQSSSAISTNGSGMLFNTGGGAQALVYPSATYVDNLVMGYNGSANISTYTANESINISANGTGTVNVNDTLNVAGNINLTGGGRKIVGINTVAGDSAATAASKGYVDALGTTSDGRYIRKDVADSAAGKISLNDGLAINYPGGSWPVELKNVNTIAQTPTGARDDFLIEGDASVFVKLDNNNNQTGKFAVYDSTNSEAFSVDEIGDIRVKERSVISNGGYAHTARSTVENRYGYFEARDNSGDRAFYLGFGNGGTQAQFALEAADRLEFSGGLLDMNTNRITGLPSAASASDAVSRGYGDGRYLNDGGGVNNGAVDIIANDGDFVIRDSTDGMTNYFWRDHSANKLYLGTPNAQPELRAAMDAGGNKITDLAAPTAAADATTKAYVDNLVLNGTVWKAPSATSAAGTHGTCNAAKEGWTTYINSTNVINTCNGSAWVAISATAGIPLANTTTPGTVVFSAASDLQGSNGVATLRNNSVDNAAISNTAAYTMGSLVTTGDVTAQGLRLNSTTRFFADTTNRIATDDDLYVRGASNNTYLYSANTYLGNSGDLIHLRGNQLDWNTGKLMTNGNLGLGTGTDNPNARLVVEGANYNQMNVRHPGNASWGLLISNSNGTSNSGYHYSSSGNNNSVALINYNADALHLGTANTSRMMIDHLGNVGIGDSTPNAGLKLDVEGKVGATEYCDQNGANCVAAGGLADNLGNHLATATINTNGNDIDFVRGNVGQIRSVGEISFDWTAGTYDAAANHGIQSKSEAGAWSDKIRINSYGDIINTIDSNSNSTSYFKVQRQSAANGEDLLAINESGDAVLKRDFSARNITLEEAAPEIRLVDNNASARDYWIHNNSNRLYILSNTLGTETTYGAARPFTVHNNRIGINNISPAHPLDVTGTARFTGTVVGATPTAVNHLTTKAYVDTAVAGAADNLGNHLAAQDLDMSNNSITNVSSFVIDAAAADWHIAHDTNSTLSIFENSVTGANNRFAIYPGGNVQINNDLEVVGDVTAATATAGSLTSTGRSIFFGTEGTAGQYLAADNSTATYLNSNHSTVSRFGLRDQQALHYGSLYGDGNGANFGLLDGDGNWSYLAAKDNYTAFRINNIERMRINSAGNVSAASFTGSGAAVTNVNATTLDGIDSVNFLRSNAADTASGLITFGGNAEMSNGTPQVKYNDTTAGSKDYWTHVNNNRFYLLSNTTGSEASHTQYPLTVKNNYLGVNGVVDPAYPLDVNGIGRFTGVVSAATPTSASHLTTKAYVDGLIGGAGDNLGNHTATQGIVFSEPGNTYTVDNDGSSFRILDGAANRFNINSAGGVQINGTEYVVGDTTQGQPGNRWSFHTPNDARDSFWLAWDTNGAGAYSYNSIVANGPTGNVGIGGEPHSRTKFDVHGGRIVVRGDGGTGANAQRAEVVLLEGGTSSHNFKMRNSSEGLWFSGKANGGLDEGGWDTGMVMGYNYNGALGLAVGSNWVGGPGAWTDRTYIFHADGDAIADSWDLSSDRRLKTDIQDIENGVLEKVLKLEGKTYYWKDKGSSQSLQRGFIAQDIKKLFPELVKGTEGEGGSLTLNYDGIIPILTEAIKEQQVIIEDQKAQIDVLKERMSKIEIMLLE